MASARSLARFLWSDYTPVANPLLLGILFLSFTQMVPESWDPGIAGVFFLVAFVFMVRTIVMQWSRS